MCHEGSGGPTTEPLGPGPQAPELHGAPKFSTIFFIGHTYLLMPVYSLGAWAIDQSSPPDPALRHGCNFLPGVPHLPRFRLHVSPPGVSWPSSFPLPLGVPRQGLSCDASCRFSQRVTNPAPFSSFYFYWQLICLGPQSVVADFV